MTRRLLLVGAGRHAERIYLPVLKDLTARGEVVLTGVVELASRAAHVKQLITAPLTVVPDHLASDQTYVLAATAALHAATPFDAMLIANDPRCRSAYFEFACTRGIDVLTDKPVFALDGIAHDPGLAGRYRQQLSELEDRVRAAGIEFVIQTQRRDHPGYKFIRELVNVCTRAQGVPVTSLQIQHADGMWVLEDEWEREYHPYKYGFGKLFHSGYHFVDLAAFLLEDSIKSQALTSVEVAAKGVIAGAAPLPKTGRIMPALDRSGYGEYDLHAMLDFGPTVAQLALLQNSFSDRDPQRPVKDHYKGIGRVRHERVDLKVSTLMNVQVHSYQSSSTSHPAGNVAGQTDHFEIMIFRNPSRLSGKPFERHTLSDICPDVTAAHNESARISLLKKFLRREHTGSNLIDHRMTGSLVSAIYTAVAARPGSIGTASAPLF